MNGTWDTRTVARRRYDFTIGMPHVHGTVTQYPTGFAVNGDFRPAQVLTYMVTSLTLVYLVAADGTVFRVSVGAGNKLVVEQAERVSPNTVSFFIHLDKLYAVTWSSPTVTVGDVVVDSKIVASDNTTLYAAFGGTVSALVNGVWSQIFGMDHGVFRGLHVYKTHVIASVDGGYYVYDTRTRLIEARKWARYKAGRGVTISSVNIPQTVEELDARRPDYLAGVRPLSAANGIVMENVDGSTAGRISTYAAPADTLLSCDIYGSFWYISDSGEYVDFSLPREPVVESMVLISVPSSRVVPFRLVSGNVHVSGTVWILDEWFRVCDSAGISYGQGYILGRVLGVVTDGEELYVIYEPKNSTLSNFMLRLCILNNALSVDDPMICPLNLMMACVYRGGLVAIFKVAEGSMTRRYVDADAKRSRSKWVGDIWRDLAFPADAMFIVTDGSAIAITCERSIWTTDETFVETDKFQMGTRPNLDPISSACVYISAGAFVTESPDPRRHWPFDVYDRLNRVRGRTLAWIDFHGRYGLMETGDGYYLEALVPQPHRRVIHSTAKGPWSCEDLDGWVWINDEFVVLDFTPPAQMDMVVMA